MVRAVSKNSPRLAQAPKRRSRARVAADGHVVHDVWTGDGVRLALTEMRAGPRPAGGPVFLLVAGFAQNRRAFTEGALPDLISARGGRVFIGELRGHGRSRGARPPPRWTVASHVAYDLPALTRAVLRITGAAQVHYVGHSLGGLLALAWLPQRPPLASLTTFAAPLHMGSDRPVVRRTARLARAANAARPYREVPMRSFLRAISGPLSLPDPDPIRGWFQRYTGLASPSRAHPAALQRILAAADPESPEVFDALLAMAATGRPVLAGYDLAAAARAADLPWVAIHGERDIFAPPSSVAELRAGSHAGPRRVLEVPGATHVDVAVGHHLLDLVARWWPLLFGAEQDESR